MDEWPEGGISPVLRICVGLADHSRQFHVDVGVRGDLINGQLPVVEGHPVLGGFGQVVDGKLEVGKFGGQRGHMLQKVRPQEQVKGEAIGLKNGQTSVKVRTGKEEWTLLKK